MTLWLVEPHDPLVVRDGRPFGPNPGARAATLPFPYPSTISGALRTRIGTAGTGAFDHSTIDVLKGIGIRGPLLAELDDAGVENLDHLLAPAPADALLLPHPDKKRAERIRLLPLTLPDGAQVALPHGLGLVGQVKPRPDKPLAEPPRFWYWPHLEEWLSAGATDVIALRKLGMRGLAASVRMHPQIDRESQTAGDGMLFQTSGLEFSRKKNSGDGWSSLALVVDGAEPSALADDDFAALGGERRLARWHTSTLQLPACPDEVRKALHKERHCRLILLTPACFDAGFLPGDWLTGPNHTDATVLAAAVGKPQIISGWNLETGHPKPTRRLAPAGSVYFLKLHGKSDEEIDRFIARVWMQNVSDALQDRLDGFGLAVLGTWDGHLHTMEVN